MSNTKETNSIPNRAVERGVNDFQDILATEDCVIAALAKFSGDEYEQSAPKA